MTRARSKARYVFAVAGFATFFLPLAGIFAGPLDIQKLRLKGAQSSKELRHFLETGLVAQRQTAIEMQIENFERSLTGYKEAKHTERNAALRQVQTVYEKFQGEFQAVADILRALVDKHQSAYNERSGEAFGNTATREKVLSTVEVGKQEEVRALAAYNNRNFSYSAHLYLRSLRHYTSAFEMRGWQPLVIMPAKPGKKPKAEKAPPAPAAAR
ncbi:MAG: hypothetical protein ACOY5B_00185 [Spirochaetota bacterium]